MSGSFADDLRDGYRQVAPVLSERELDLLSRARDFINRSPGERNRILGQVVAAYRAGPRQLWAPVLLDLLAPSLTQCLRGFRAEPPALDAEDIRQQLVLEVLRAARCMPIHDGGRQMKVRLITRANRSVVRWLKREGLRQSSQSSFETVQEEKES